MEKYYLIVVIGLIVLAVSNLIVGVSNGTDHFLYSVFGSRVAKRKLVLIEETPKINVLHFQLN